ncbi:MAG: UDP-N-acetylmuramate--L-alanine ligase [Clostridiales bacterium]|nr:UDP-N-acetylmuramate--L-alanine ligase [Clostridiales bacterium]
MDTFEELPGSGKYVYFIGVGGISMSSMAEILKSRGFSVAGSDMAEGEQVSMLRRLGVPVFIGHDAGNLDKIGAGKIGLVVNTAAVKPDNPEMVKARALGLPILERAPVLGKMASWYENSIGIAGMHGKTTTTSMTAQILLDDGRDPTISVGGVMRSIGGNFRVGRPDLFVFEACEYCDSFLSFYPKYSAILNIDADHLDYFKDLAHIRRSFRRYAENAGHTLVINAAIPSWAELVSGLPARAVTFKADGGPGLNSGFEADFSAGNIAFGSSGASFEIREKGEEPRVIRLKTGGAHNVENALAAFALCASIGVSRERAALSLENFENPARRFEIKGNYRGAVIADDYAHHPTEIRTALAAARSGGWKRILCLFQPHTYTRTAALFDEFAAAFENADEAAFVDIYAARERDTGIASSRELASAVAKTGRPAAYLKSFGEAAGYYRENLREGDLLITMGAGDVYKIGEKILDDKE